MRRTIFLGALASAALIGLSGQSSYDIWHQPDGTGIVGQVIYCSTGKPREAAPCGSMAAPMNVRTYPFARSMKNPIKLKGLGPTPKTFAVQLPAGATTYRIAQNCFVDVRLLGTMDPAESVSADTGLLYLARTTETMGTSKPAYISGMTVGTPTDDCSPELIYGTGGG